MISFLEIDIFLFSFRLTYRMKYAWKNVKVNICIWLNDATNRIQQIFQLAK